MKTFLAQVAADIYQKYGNNMGNLCMIFPSRRVRIFFEQELSELITAPIWQPCYKSIDDLVQQLSIYSRAEELKLLAKLHEVYSRYHVQDFDKFYRWGLMLLADFDTIDKYMIDAARLYANISDIKEIDMLFDDYNDQERELIFNFWSSFRKDQAESEQERIFINIWSSLAAIYHEFKQELEAEGIAYAGMQYRELAQRTMDAVNQDKGDQILDVLSLFNTDDDLQLEYCFVGFNALSTSEMSILGFMQKTLHNARFYWDYDKYYMPLKGIASESTVRQAGRFVAKNIKFFGQEYDIESDNFNNAKNIEVVETPSEVMQCKALYYKLEQIHAQQGFVDRETAIILTDEQLLGPVLSSVPGCVEKINVTMGCRLADTVPYVFMDKMLDLELGKNKRGYYHRLLKSTFSHPYFRGILANAVERRLLELQYVYVKGSELVSMVDELYANLLMLNTAAEQGEEPEINITSGADLDLLDRQKDLMKAMFSDNQYNSFGDKLCHVLQLCDNDYLTKQLSYDHENESEKELESEPQSNLDISQEQLYIISIMVGEITSLRSSIDQCGLEISDAMYARLLRKRLKSTKIPYSGEPLEGLQVMGILETRCLDFKNIIYLSMADDNFPGAISGGSYIPVSLRQAFGLPSISDHEAVYAYYFYRSIQRCQNLVMMYCSASQGVQSGEQSRYIHQLNYDSVHNIRRSQVLLSGVASNAKEFRIKKTEDMVKQIANHTFSASQINTYIMCPMKFYLSTISKIRKQDSVEEQISSLDMGNIFHKSMELLYTPIMSKANHRAEIKKITKKQISEAVMQAVLCIVGDRGRADSGSVALSVEVVERYVGYVVRYDSESSQDFRIIGIEQKFDSQIAGLKVRGVIDRVDRMSNGDLRVIDYKTGMSYSPTLSNSIYNMFDKNGSKEHNSAVLQTAIYARALGINGEKSYIYPSIYVCAKMFDDQFDPSVVIKTRTTSTPVVIDADVCKMLDDKLSSIKLSLEDINLDFECCDNSRKCKYCDYISICAK